MPTDRSEQTPLVEGDMLLKVRALKAQIERLDELTGGFSTKHEVRQTGCSMHVKFGNKVDILDSLEMANLMLGAAARTHALCRLLLGEPS